MWIRTTAGELVNADQLQVLRTKGNTIRAFEQGEHAPAFTLATCNTEEEAEQVINRIAQGLAGNVCLIDLTAPQPRHWSKDVMTDIYNDTADNKRGIKA